MNSLIKEGIKESQKGLFVICLATKPTGNRLYLRSLTNSINNNEEFNFNIFTISVTNVTAGTYVCEIQKFKTDKNGNPMMIVTPVMEILDTRDISGVVWSLLNFENVEGQPMFSDYYCDVNKVIQKVRTDLYDATRKYVFNKYRINEEQGYVGMESHEKLWEMLADGSLSFLEFVQSCNEVKYVSSALIGYIHYAMLQKRPDVVDQYPILSETVNANAEYCSLRKFRQFVDELNDSYEILLKRNEVKHCTSPYARAEIVLVSRAIKRYERRQMKEQERREKRQERKSIAREKCS